MTDSNHSFGVRKISERAAWTTELGPMILFAHVNMPPRISPATSSGSCSAIHPIRHPGKRNRLERPLRVMMGTVVDSDARGWKGAFQVYTELMASVEGSYLPCDRKSRPQ